MALNALAPMWILAAVTVTAGAAQPDQWMQEDELRATFAGQTLGGYYPDGVSFDERYLTDGTIIYRDDRQASSGNWSIAGQEFCTFYKDIVGACFRAHRVSENCFRFYLTSEVGLSQPSAMAADNYEVTGWLTSLPSTCPPPPSV